MVALRLIPGLRDIVVDAIANQAELEADSIGATWWRELGRQGVIVYRPGLDWATSLTVALDKLATGGAVGDDAIWALAAIALESGEALDPVVFELDPTDHLERDLAGVVVAGQDLRRVLRRRPLAGIEADGSLSWGWISASEIDQLLVSGQLNQGSLELRVFADELSRLPAGHDLFAVWAEVA